MLTLTAGTDVADAVRDVLENATGTAWVEGFGEVSDAVIIACNAEGARFERSLSGHWDLVSLRASDAVKNGLAYVQLSRDTGVAVETAAGTLVRATVVCGALRANATGREEVRVIPAAPSPVAAHVAAETPRAPLITPAPAPNQPPVQVPPAAGSSPGIAAAPMTYQSAVLPKKIAAKDESLELYPEEGDLVSHFAFGECVVVFSDGERLRLQQDKDSRVREVALSMLKLQLMSNNDGELRRWELKRKN